MKTLLVYLSKSLNRASRLLAPPEPHAITPLEQIPTVALGELLGDAKPEIRLVVQKYEDGILPSEQALAMLSLLVVAKPKVILEIGTFMGGTTKLLAINAPDAVVHTVDLPVNYSKESDKVVDLKKDDFHLIAARNVGRDFKDSALNRQIVQHFCDTALWDFNLAAGAEFFFIDGAHTYDYCKSDSERCFELCRGRGTFIWHDCDSVHPGVVNLLNEWRAAGRAIVRIDGTPLAYWSSHGI